MNERNRAPLVPDPRFPVDLEAAAREGEGKPSGSGRDVIRQEIAAVLRDIANGPRARYIMAVELEAAAVRIENRRDR